MSQFTFSLQPGESVSYDIDQVFLSKQTKFQNIDVVKTKSFGLAIFVDQKPQSSEVDHFIFNEALVHPAFGVNKNIRSVFLAGGGPGSALREICRHSFVQNIVMCDIDREAVDFYRRTCSNWHHNAFLDARVNLEFNDARKYLETCKETFDLILIDVPDPIEQGTTDKLFSREFYQVVKSRLSEPGVFVTQAGRTNINNLKYHACIYRTVSDCFAAAESYECNIPFYGENWGFMIASDTKYDWKQVENTDVSGLLFYNSDIHAAMFAKPNYFIKKVAKLGELITDAVPLIVK